MSVLDKVLSLRPANAVARLGQKSRVPLLNPEDLLRALEGSPVALPCVPVRAKAAVPGLLAAARSEDAVLGLACSHPLADRGATERFLAAVKAAATEAEHARPLFLQAGPVRVAKPKPEGVRLQQEAIFRLVDDGFSLVSLDVSRLEPAAAVEVVQTLSAPLRERELPLELTLPARAQEWETPVDTARPLLEGMRQAGVPVRFLRVSAPALGEEDLDVGLLHLLVELATDHGVSVTVADVNERTVRAMPTLVAAGVRKVDCIGPFDRVALAAWPAEARAVVEQKAEAAGLSPAELLGLLEEQLPPLELAAQERLEALSFAEATVVLGLLGASRTGWRAMNWLAENRGD
ncbi:hypothetical protein [Hyalangium rubrum]|uniref:EAL domain-containing protein n=1 Tax=Hyalangium rubrum TaxID=3103134 RepID=A0ABU5HHL6_9BACT|nr:hypothetical protein [Hyalangium sp. s54d21]MDY7232958.1 hypothetical protein [Hyalangium sp. s54d21]